MSERKPQARKATKKDIQDVADVFEELLVRAEEDIDLLSQLGMHENPVVTALEWLYPQAERVLKRCKRGDLTLPSDESVTGLMATLEMMTDLAADLIDAIETVVHEAIQQPSPVTHKR